MSDFSIFSKAVADQFAKMSKGRIFKVDVDPDVLYQRYQDAFPKGTNEIYRVRREYDCSMDRHFIKNLGKIVSIENNRLVTVWDVTTNEYPFDIVAKVMSEFINKQHIQNVYYTKFPKYGAEFTLELKPDNTTHRWNHFVGYLNRQHIHPEPDTKMSEFLSEFQLLKRGLEELSISAMDIVLDLINENNLYRGQEHAGLVRSFKEIKQKYDAYKNNDKDLFIWQNVGYASVSRFRNTVIGTLVTDLSDGMDIEQAVRMFESKVAPSNYKRPKSLITPSMIKDAMKTISELGLESSLERRFAKFSDMSVANVLFVDNSVKPLMIGGLEDKLLEAVKIKAVDVKNSQDITVDEFMNNVLPKANQVQVMLKNKNVKNLVSLTAPVNTDIENLFKWGNNFAWSYNGNMADSSIKSKVKSAGGNVDALLRCSLAWFNYDDLDIHAQTPDGNHIYYGNKAGILDVDMNAGSGKTREAVENLSWTSLRDGKYTIAVNNFSRRESIDVGFTLELEYLGDIKTYHYANPLDNSKTIQCLELTVKDKQLIDVKILNKLITCEQASQQQWGVNTETFVDVSSVILSPNYWDENASGNKHWFFVLKDCKNPDSIRGIYNEFLKPELDKHRKVFEIIGEKTKCPYADEQMSGIGFSSTKEESLVVKVKTDKTQQVYNIQF